MKKVTDFLKPNILIIFGALLFLYYLNFLSYRGAGLALGIVAIVFSVYYLAIGVALVLMGNKLAPSVEKVLGVVSTSLFIIFMFVYFLLATINLARAMGPTAWTIKILSMIASLALLVIFALYKFGGSQISLRLANLFSAIFTLALLLDLLFDGAGNSTVLGNVDVLLVVIYAVYTFILFSALGKTEAAPAENAAKEEEPAEPASEKPAEEPAPEETV